MSRHPPDSEVRKPKAQKGSKKTLTWGSIAAGLFVLATLLGWLDGPWVGLLAGTVFFLLGIWIAFTVFGPYDGHPAKMLFQAPGRLLLGGLLIFLGGLALVSASSDLRPRLNWEHPWFGDLRTLFWSQERFAAMACYHAGHEPIEALQFALERAPKRRLLCPQPNATDKPLLELAETSETIEFLLAASQYHQGDLDRKLIELCRQGNAMLPAIESLLSVGANPNAEVDYDTALSAAFGNEQTSLAIWLLEHGAQANFSFSTGETLLQRAEQTPRVDLKPVYVEMLRSRGASQKPKLELTPGGR